MKPEIIIRVQFPSFGVQLLEQDFEVHYAPTLEQFEQAIDKHGKTVRALVTNGSIGVTANQLQRLEKLEMIVTQGVGYENVDMPTVKERGFVLTTGKGTNAFSVADHAMALLLGIARNIVWADARVREGLWVESRGPRALAWKKRLGILGMGEIGLMVARRALGFDMEVSYHNRHRRDDVDLSYKESPIALAAASDFVVITMPGGAETRGLVDRAFLDALGPQGYLINLGRGTIVDNKELVSALHDKRIAGAALDVVAGEPTVPPELLEAPNLIITPHMASRSPESVSEAMNRISSNLRAHFAGQPLVSQIA